MSLWGLSLNWDTKIPQLMQSQWVSMPEELTGLNEFTFIRRTRPTKFYVFCDASHQAYRFLIHGVQDENIRIIFAKTKVALIKSKSLTTLEFLTDFTAFKALYFVVRGYSDTVITGIYTFADAQVMWSAIKGQHIDKKCIRKDINGL